MLLEWVHKDSEVGSHAKGPWDLLWKERLDCDRGPRDTISVRVSFRAPKTHINKRILQTIASGIPLILDLGTRM